MADPIVTGQAPLTGGAQNPFSSFSQGMQTGQDWAVAQAHVNLMKQNLQQQQQQHDEMKRQFGIKLQQQNMDYENNILNEIPGSAVQKSKIKSYQEYRENSGQDTDPAHMTALGDIEYQPQMRKVTSGMLEALGLEKNQASTAGDALMAYGEHFGRDNMQSVLEKSMNAIAESKRYQNQFALQAERLDLSKKRFGFQEQKTGQQQYNDIQKPVQTALFASDRIDKLLTKGMQPDGTFKVTPQVVSTIGSELAKIEVGGNQTSEGSRERGLYTSYAQDFRGLLQKVEDAPQGVLSKENADQITGQIKEMRGSYRDQHDKMVDTIKAGTPDAQQQAIEARANQFRKQWKDWGGKAEDQSGAPPTSAPVSPNADKSAQLQKVKALFDKASDPSDKQAILQRLQKKGYTPEELEAAGFGKAK